VTIHPRPDQEIKIEEAIQAGLVRSAEEVIDAGLEHLRGHAPDLPAVQGQRKTEAQDVTAAERRKREGRKSLPEIFEPIRGLLSE
jgi:hypothetical protein